MILNLVYPEKSDIHYKINNYPDGQSDLQITEPTDHWDIVNVTIQSRFNSFKDLELILCATKIFKSLGSHHIHLYIPYILGGRSDRKFVRTGVSYLRDIIAPIINAQKYSSVTVKDPHSDVTEAVINNLIKIPNSNIVDEAIASWNMHINHPFILVSPDAGALKKIYEVAEFIGYDRDIIVASKHRDVATGKILSTEVPNLIAHQGCDFVIIDDICDGGRTFIEIAKKIKKSLPGDRCGKIYLVVTHGIFSAGLKELSEYFDGIYTTNSVQDIPTSKNYKGADFDVDFVKQLNVF